MVRSNTFHPAAEKRAQGQGNSGTKPKQTDRETDRETDRQTDRQTDRHTHTHTQDTQRHTQTHTDTKTHKGKKLTPKSKPKRSRQRLGELVVGHVEDGEIVKGPKLRRNASGQSV